MRKFSHSVKFYFVVQNLKIGQTLINSAKYVFFEKYEFFSQKLKTKGGGSETKNQIGMALCCNMDTYRNTHQALILMITVEKSE